MQVGSARRRVAYLHIAPANAPTKTRTDGLERCFFGGEAGRQLRHRIAPAQADPTLVLGEDALEEPVTTSLPRGTKTGELDQVEAETDNCFRIGIH